MKDRIEVQPAPQVEWDGHAGPAQADPGAAEAIAMVIGADPALETDDAATIARERTAGTGADWPSGQTWAEK